MKLAFCIPAYNNPEYLYKCLKSLCGQKNKSFDILISDDFSPISLLPVVDKVRMECEYSINIECTRHESNLGIYWNTRYVFDSSHHQYKVLMQHDDVVIDELFTQKIINIFEKNDDCGVIIFNAITEFSGNKSFINENDFMMDGKFFLSQHLFKNIHPSYSSVVLNTKFLNINAYKSMFVPRLMASQMKVEIDECFQILSMILTEGNVFVSGEIATIRGEPNTSATQRNELPFKTAAQGMLIAYYQLFRYMKYKGFTECAVEMARLLVYVFPSPTLNLKLIHYFRYEFDFIKFHFCGIFIRNIRRLKRAIIR